MLLQPELPWRLGCSALKEKQQPALSDLVEEEVVVVVRQLVDNIIANKSIFHKVIYSDSTGSWSPRRQRRGN